MIRSTVYYSLVAITLGSLTISAQAQTIIAPNTLATTEGNALINTAPFNNISRYQQIYNASEFASLSGPAFITQIAFRPDASQTTAFSRTFFSFQINLSTTSQTVSGLSPIFADNVGADNTTVQNGALTLTTANILGPGTAKQFDLLINLTAPFLYDPGAGNLLMDIFDFSTGFTGYIDAAIDTTANPKIKLAFADSDPILTSSGSVQPGGLVTRFTFTPFTIPEPGTLALIMGAGIVLVIFNRTRSYTLTHPKSELETTTLKRA
jgi:hypothetical protein